MLPEDQDRLRTLLTDTVVLLCKNGLSYSKGFSIEGLIGITVDESEVFLVSVHEEVKAAMQEIISASPPPDLDPVPGAIKRKGASFLDPTDAAKVQRMEEGVMVKREEEEIDVGDERRASEEPWPDPPPLEVEAHGRSKEQEESNGSEDMDRIPLSTALDMLDDDCRINESTFDCALTEMNKNLSFKCNICGKVFRSESSFKVHQVIHTDAHKCQYCGKCFACNSKLRTHLSTHDSTLKLPCLMCDKSFAGPSELKRHTDIAHKPQ